MRPDFTVKKGKPYPMGMTAVGDEEVNFAAVLPGREECGVILYPAKGGSQIRLPFRQENRIGNICCMRVQGICMAEYSYNFYAGEDVITDPYAKRIRGNEKWGQKVSPALQGGEGQEAFNWGQDAPLMTPLCDSLLYLIHVRGFTKHASSGVAHRGTFAGLAEKIPYLNSLGITAVELMPVYEFLELERPEKRSRSMAEAVAHYRDKEPEEQEQPRINYWGFKKGYYFAPKASYAASQDPEGELKAMVRQLHENGIEVILQFYFPKEIKGAYILEVLKYWAFEYHIDGFHLMGERIPTALIATDPLLSNTKLFYYDFLCGEIYDTQDAPDYQNLACYRDDFLYDMRRFLKGDEDMLTKALYQLKKNPGQTGVINYMANYEGFSLADMVAYERKHNEDNGEENRDGISYNASWNCGSEGKTRKKSVLALRQQQLKNAMMLLLTAQGTPMIVAGDEFGHSRKGNNNAYCQDNGINWLNWKLTESNRAFLEFTKELIALRRAHPILHKPDAFSMLDYIACGYPDLSYHGREAWRLGEEPTSREAGLLYCGNYAKIDRKKSDDFFYIAYNMHWEAETLALPPLPAGLHWEVVQDSAGGQQEAGPAEGDPGQDSQVQVRPVQDSPGQGSLVQSNPVQGSPVQGSPVQGREISVAARSIRILKSCGAPVKEGKDVEGITAF